MRSHHGERAQPARRVLSGVERVLRRSVAMLRHLALIAMTAAALERPAHAATAYVANSLDGTVSVVDVGTGASRATVPVGVAPQDVLVHSRARRVFVSSAGDSPNALPDVVTAIDAKRNLLAGTFDAGATPVGMAAVPRSWLLLVANFYSGTPRVMRARTGKLLRTIPVGAGADAVAVVR